MPRSLAVRLASVGALAQVAGFAIDALLHGRDPGLAAREGVFNLGNAGHGLVAVGLTLVVLGLGMVWAGAGSPEQAPGLVRAVPGMVMLGLAVATMASLLSGHEHAEDRGVEEARARAARVIPGLVHAHGRPSPSRAMDAATRRILAAELVEARAVAQRYPTAADAQAAGYRLAVPYVPLIGAHYLRDDLMRAPFSVDRPAMLLYDGTQPDAQVVGLSYYVTSRTEPDGFAGEEDRWHRHVGLCLDDRLVVVGGEGLSEMQCRALGGHKYDGADGWMVHAWVVPGWESPDGVFSAENRYLL